MRQLALPVPNTWGGRRPDAGRKPRGLRPNVSHRTRPYHDASRPAHVTLRARSGLPSLRRQRVFGALRESIRLAQRERFRMSHFSVQSTHVHMLLEATSRQALSQGMQGLAIRLARAINRALARRGSVWADQYHRRDLKTPREVRNALVYVLQNVKKHQPAKGGLEPCSSARWITGWQDLRSISVSGTACPVAQPRTWLLDTGWRRSGLLGVGEAPRSP